MYYGSSIWSNFELNTQFSVIGQKSELGVGVQEGGPWLLSSSRLLAACHFGLMHHPHSISHTFTFQHHFLVIQLTIPSTSFMIFVSCGKHLKYIYRQINDLRLETSKGLKVKLSISTMLYHPKKVFHYSSKVFHYSNKVFHHHQETNRQLHEIK